MSALDLNNCAKLIRCCTLSIRYLCRGHRASASALEEIRANVHDEVMKMMNLSHTWLQSNLPHILTKINRVEFGILNEEDLERALRIDPNMPTSRKLCAVPFVGKDVPSRSSEFAQPDVVIGNTILAFRYDGMRPSDFRSLVKHMRGLMEEEYGKYEQRPSCREWIKWITMAGGKVRGIDALTASAARDGFADETKGEGPGGGGSKSPRASSRANQLASSTRSGDESKHDLNAIDAVTEELAELDGQELAEFRLDNVVPLQLVDLRNDELANFLYGSCRFVV